MPRGPFAFHEVVRLFVFCEACAPLPMGEGPGVRAGLGEGFLCFDGVQVGTGSPIKNEVYRSG